MMGLQFSKEKICSFAGDVVALQLCGRDHLENAPVRWMSSDETVVRIRNFIGEEGGFSDKVLLTLLKEGTAQVTASLDGEMASCPVKVHCIKHADPEGKMNYYRGDMHAHTSFSDGVGTPKMALSRVKQEGTLDFYVISDHGVAYTPEKCFANVLAAEEATGEDFVALAAQEADLYLTQQESSSPIKGKNGPVLPTGTVFLNGWESTAALCWASPIQATWAIPTATSGTALTSPI